MSFLDSVPVISSKRKIDRANSIVEKADYVRERADSNLKKANLRSIDASDSLLEVKVRCQTESIPYALDILEKCQKLNRKETKISNDPAVQFSKNTAPRLREQSIETLEVMKTGVKGTSTGAALALGSMSAVSTLGTASTGTAIATLSGAAANSATLAWFGGGALSAGGAGIAGGTLVLGGIALAPLAVFGALKYASHAEKKLTAANNYYDNAYVYETDIGSLIEVSDKLNEHVSFWEGLVEDMEQRLVLLAQALDEDLKSEGKEHVRDLKVIVLLFVKALKRILEVNVIDEKQKPSAESIRIAQHADNLDEENIASFLEETTTFKKVKPPKEIKYLSEVSPGKESPKFFWFMDIIAEYKKKKPKKIKQGGDSKQIKFIEAFLTLTICGLLAFFGLLLDWGAITSVFLWFAVIAPLTWIGEKTGETGQGIAGLIIIVFTALLLNYHFSWF